MEFYVDGSYKDNRVCYGFIFIKNGRIKNKYYHVVEDNLGLTSCYAELKAVMSAVKMAKQMGIKAKIFYDFSGSMDIIKSDNASHNSKYSSFLMTYKQFMVKNRGHYELIKVKAHSKDQFNLYIDKIVHNGIDGLNDFEPGKLIRIKQ